MPGKRPNDNGYSHVTGIKLLREVTAPDADLASVPVLDLAVQERTNPKGEALGISVGASNKLTLGVLFGAGAAGCTIEVFLDMYPNDVELADEAADWEGRWVQVGTLAVTESGSLVLPEIYPGKVKVQVTAVTGKVYIVYSRTE
jgi:hypothetical protein